MGALRRRRVESRDSRRVKSERRACEKRSASIYSTDGADML